MFERKLIAASFASSLAVLILPFVFWSTESYSDQVRDLSGYFLNVLIYGVYVFPAVFTYGICTSLLTEYLVSRFSLRPATLLMAVGHLVFGAVLFVFSLVPAILFFLFDRLIARLMPTHFPLLKRLGYQVPLGVFLLCLIFRGLG